jgi:hypothetical protein
MPLYPHDLACLHLHSSQPASVTSTIEVGAGVKSPYDSLPNRRQISRDFVPWRFSDADRISAWRVSSCRRPRNLHKSCPSRYALMHHGHLIVWDTTLLCSLADLAVALTIGERHPAPASAPALVLEILARPDHHVQAPARTRSATHGRLSRLPDFHGVLRSIDDASGAWRNVCRLKETTARSLR